MPKQKCRYESCDHVEEVSEESRCAGCEALVAQIRERIERGDLPKVNLREVKGPRMTAVLLPRGGMPCVACDQTIDGEHFAYPDYPVPAGPRRGDLHMHELCHEIWDQEAAYD
jgi:hypothetical protein